MSSPNDIIREESLPLGKTITLSQETAKGFVDRANRFRVDAEGTFLADRWCSNFFNVRSSDPENPPKMNEGFKSSPGPGSSREADAGHFTMSTESFRGFVDRGGRFQGSGEGGDLGDRLVSDWFNFRQTQGEGVAR
jgi:hypothetical protein